MPIGDPLADSRSWMLPAPDHTMLVHPTPCVRRPSDIVHVVEEIGHRLKMLDDAFLVIAKLRLQLCRCFAVTPATLSRVAQSHSPQRRRLR